MKIQFTLFAVALCVCVQQAQAGWLGTQSSNVFKRQEYDSVASLNGLLEDSVDSDTLGANIQGVEGILRTDRDVLNDQTVLLAQQFKNLGKINAENICSDESLNYVKVITESMKKISPRSFEFPEVKHQLNRIVANIAASQLTQCFDKFAGEWSQIGNANEIFPKLVEFNYLAGMLSYYYQPSSQEEHTIINVNRWLLKQSKISLDVDDHTIESVRVTSYVLQKQPVTQATYSKAEIRKYLEELLVNPCKSFMEDSRVSSLKKVLSLLITGNIPINSVDRFYAESETLEWAKRLYSCQRLLISDENKLVDQMSRLSMGQMTNQ